MKQLRKVIYFILVVASATIFTSCSPADKKNAEAEHDHAKESEATAVSESTGTETAFPMAAIVADYIALKNALVSDDGTAAAGAGKTLHATLAGVDMSTIPGDKHKEYMEIAEDAKENAEHIGENEKNIGHQREHFVALSKDVDDMIKMFGAPQKLYQDFCPMYDNNKGAMWLSETKEIKNPYYGSKMLTCGSVKNEY